MIRRSTWIVLTVFVALVLLAVFWEDIPALNPPQDTPTPMAEVPQLFDFSVDEVRQLALSDNLGNSRVYRRDVDGLWFTDSLPETAESELDSALMLQAVSQMAYWRALTTIDSTTELEAVGLVTPTASIEITLVNGEVLHVDIGDVTVTGSGYYVRSGSQPPQVVSMSEVDQVVELLYSPPVVQETPTPQP